MADDASATPRKRSIPEKGRDAARLCPACRGDVPVGARKCPHCKGLLGLRRLAALSVKWAGAALTVLTLTLGVRQLVGMGVGAIEGRGDRGTRIRAAEKLVTAGEYAPAWDILEPLEDARNGAVRETRLVVARAWLLHARSIAGVSTFLDVTDRVIPIIASAVDDGDLRQQAERRALLGYTQFLRSREEAIRVDPVPAYLAALEIDPDCGLAHLLLGSYLAGWSIDFERGLAHLQRAVELERAGQLDDVSARAWQLDAILDHKSSGSIPNPSYTEAVVALVRTLDDIRRTDGSLPVSNAFDRSNHGLRDPYWSHVQSAYRHVPTDDRFALPLRGAIPLDDHIALVQWLRERAPQVEPDPWLSAWLASFQEEAGDTSGAIETYRSVSAPGYRLARLWDEALIRLTGEPHRPLSERDPWAHATRVLTAGDPTSDEFGTALAQLDVYMDSHARGARYADAEALKAARAARENIAQRGSAAHAGTYSRVALHQGRLLLSTGHAREAVGVLSGLERDLAADDSVRAELLVTLAAAFAQRFESSKQAGDLDQAAARLREAVEQAGYADWARIRWFEDLRPVRAHPEYVALLGRHGRSVGGAWGGSRSR